MFPVEPPGQPLLELPPVLDLPPAPAPDAALQARLDAFRDLLLRWTTRINLIAERDPAAIERRHIADSLQLAPLLATAPPGPLADLGSGAGFPGLILALATGRETHLVESDRRKAAFLLEATRSLGLAATVTVHPARIEAVTLPPLAVLTARALAPLPELLAHAVRFLAPGGIALFPKGRTAASELTESARDWTMQAVRYRSRTDAAATILRLSDIRRVGS